jgi:magnesium transporter
MDERNRVLGESLSGLLEQGKMQAALALLDGLQPADAAEVLESVPYDERLRIFGAWDVEESSEALQEMSEDGQVEVMQGLARGLATRIISEMSPDDAVDLLADLPDKTSEGILSSMHPLKAGQLRRLLAHGEDTAGGLMTPEAMRLSEELTVAEVLEQLREAPENVEMIYYLYFHDEKNRLTGVCSLRELIIADPEKQAREIMHRNLRTVGPGEDQEKVAAMIDRYDLLAVPVVDGEGRLLGIVTVDDVMDVLEAEAREDIYSLAGSWEAEESRARPPFTAAIVGRLPWVLIALALELLVAGGILRAFSDTMQEHIALVFFIPAILAMGGTVSLQSAARMSLDLLGEGTGKRRYARSAAAELFIGLAVAGLRGGRKCPGCGV